MRKRKRSTQFHEQCTRMIARTHEGDPVWQTNERGRPFLLEDGANIKPLGLFWWWKGPGSKMRHLPKPHLTYTQVAAAQKKSQDILKALRQGPVYIDRGFLKRRNGKVITTRKITALIIHWMEGCGFVFTKEHLKDKRIRLDLDVEATRKNKVT